MDAAVALAARMKDELIKELRAWKPLPREEAERLLEEHTIGLPVEDVEKDLARVLYSGGARGHGGHTDSTR